MKSWITKNGLKIYQVLGGRSNSFIISNGHNHLLVDTGRENKREKLLKSFDLLGMKNDSFVGLILTHTHFDHAENAAFIKEKYHIPLIVHKNEAEFLQTGTNPVVKGSIFTTKYLVDLLLVKLLPRYRYEPACCDFLVEERFDLNSLGFNAYIMHTPGHSIGSLSIIIDNEIALVGDAMFGIFPGSVFPPFADNPSIMVNSWEKLIATGCTLFLPAHGTGNSRELVQKQYEEYKQSM